MARSVFFSFHYKPDNWRSSQVRNIRSLEGNQVARDNDWETITRGGDQAIKRWIDGQLHGRSCTIVLIGSETAGRKWINYEIEKSWNDGKGLVGIHIHQLKDRFGYQSHRGADPFSTFTLNSGTKRLSELVRSYESPYNDSKMAYQYIATNIENWIEEAIRIRNSV